MQMHCFGRKLCCSSYPLVPVSLPSRRETHFWYIVPDEIKDESLLNRYLGLLSSGEKESVFRMNGDKLRKRALLARALVRTTLARYTQVSPRSLKFKKNLFGKPEVEWQPDEKWDPPSLHFNISHTSSLIACGVAADMPIGIDVEEKHRKTRNNISALARRYFSTHEVEYLDNIPDSEMQQQEFIKLWTLKEAYVKALGRGFSASPFNTFTIRFKDICQSSLQVSKNFSSEAYEIVVEALNDSEHLATNCQFAIFELGNLHFAAICTQKDNITQGEEENMLKLKAWKTIPFVEDECVSETDTIIPISGLA
ncbi:hypothetical protein GIB67_009247 [Kingdonia uniflora]|uniref:holo-[acyl-carrier-protein] synthase n=1 Tax=Kingdonia uniflora TaxID=39325 RepID=A0A7J7N376_9MAGN|nr:hypothetical protein GIB67_009247 [Kingdonia uniflora]